MEDDPLTGAQHASLAELLGILEASGCWYRITGGLAGNVHGSRWPLHDVDVDVRAAEWPTLRDALGPRLLRDAAPFADDEFRLTLAVARVGDVLVELSQLENAAVHGPAGWLALPADATRRERRIWLGHTFWVQPLADLLAYKTLLQRDVDLADLRRLLSRKWVPT